MFLLQTALQVQPTQGMSETAQVLIAILPLASVMILGILTFFFMLWDHKKRMLVIQKGGTPAPRNIDDRLLLLGIVSLFIGVGLTVFMSIYNGFKPPLLGGMIPTLTGAAIITYYMIVHRKRS
jgi:hypothetical protein